MMESENSQIGKTSEFNQTMKIPELDLWQLGDEEKSPVDLEWASSHATDTYNFEQLID